jgi:hypothetical protein
MRIAFEACSSTTSSLKFNQSPCLSPYPKLGIPKYRHVDRGYTHVQASDTLQTISHTFVLPRFISSMCRRWSSPPWPTARSLPSSDLAIAAGQSCPRHRTLWLPISDQAGQVAGQLARQSCSLARLLPNSWTHTWHAAGLFVPVHTIANASGHILAPIHMIYNSYYLVGPYGFCYRATYTCLILTMKGYRSISAVLVFKFDLSLRREGCIGANAIGFLFLLFLRMDHSENGLNFSLL